MYCIPTIMSVSGTFMISACYLLLQMGKMAPNTFSYSFYNALGCILVLLSLYYAFNPQYRCE